MSKNAYVGVSGVARRVSDMCIGVSNVARKVVTGYVGVNDVARQFYPQATTPTPVEPEYPSNTSISIAASKCITENYSTLNRTNMDICYVGRAVLNYDEDSRAGAALKFNAPAAGWGITAKRSCIFIATAVLLPLRFASASSIVLMIPLLDGRIFIMAVWMRRK